MKKGEREKRNLLCATSNEQRGSKKERDNSIAVSGRQQLCTMRRLVPFLIAAMMAFPSSSFLLLLIGPVITSGGGGGISCTSSSANHCHNYGSGGALTGVVAATSTYATPSRTMSSSTAAVMMMAGSSLSVSSGLMGASATEVNFKTPHTGSDSAEPANRIDNNHGGELSLGDNQQLKVEVLGGSPHCSFSMVEFTNTVSIFFKT